MKDARTPARRLSTIALFGVLAGVLFITLCPSLEENRLEARIGHTYRTVRKMAESNFKSAAEFSKISDNETDPWGQPYIVVDLLDGVRVFSSGPNKSTTTTGFDHDDIYSDMPNSPIEAIHAAKTRQLLIALSAPVIWLIGSIAYLAMGLRPRATRQYDHTVLNG